MNTVVFTFQTGRAAAFIRSMLKRLLTLRRFQWLAPALVTVS